MNLRNKRIIFQCLFQTIIVLALGLAQAGDLVVPHLRIGDPNDWFNSTKLFAELAWDGNLTDRMILGVSEDQNTFVESNSWSPVGSLTMPAPGLPYNVKRWFRMRAVRGTAAPYLYSDYSNVVSLVTLIPPSRNLTISAPSHSTAKMTWQFYDSLDESGQHVQLLPGSGYKVERSIDPNFSPASIKVIQVDQPYVMSVDSNKNTLINFTDTDTFAPDTVYYYRVRSFTTVGTGEASAVVSIAPNALPLPVEQVVVQTTKDSTNNQSSNAVAVRFRSHSTNQLGFRIDRSQDVNNPNGWTILKTYPSASALSEYSNPFVDGNLTAGKTYFYRVVAINDVGDSPYTVESITLPQIVSPSSQNKWYVDNQAPGNGAGTDWSNAWKGFNSINWFVVKPGDTIFISGGANGQTYNEPLFTMKSGTEGHPITFKVGEESGHNGKVSITQGIFINSSWVTIDGRKDNAFTYSTLEQIVANENLDVSNPVGTCVYANVPEGVRVLWVDAHDCGGPTVPDALHGNVLGMWFNGGSGTGIRGSEIAYSHISRAWGHGILVSQGLANNYGLSSINHNIIEHVHEDFIDAGAGVDISNNIARIRDLPQFGHADGFQIWPSFIRIYNNVLHDTPGIIIYPELSIANVHHFQIYNNIFYTDQIPGKVISFTTEPASSGPPFIPVMTLSDVLIANNLIYNMNIGGLTLNRRPDLTGVLQVRNMTVKNNIFFLPTATTAGNIFDFRSDIDYTAADIAVDYNILTGSQKLGIGFKGISYPTAEDFNAAFPQYPHNSSSKPELVDPVNFDFRLVSGDSVARGKGANLSNFRDIAPCNGVPCPTPPGLDHDIAGNPRPLGSWAIGPYEYAQGQDTTAPSAPRDFSYSGLTSRAVTLSWQASPESDVAGYKLYRNNIEIGTIVSTSYRDSKLSDNTAYTYVVRAFDSSSNLSSPSGSLTFTSPNSIPLDTDAALKFHLTFDAGFFDDLVSPNSFPDVSGNGNSGQRFFFGGNSKGWPAPMKGPNGLSGAEFHIYKDGTGYQGEGSGDYVAIQRTNSLDNLSKATISLWAYYNDKSIRTSTLLDTGYDTLLGTWAIGRQSGGDTRFTIYSANTTKVVNMSFGDFPSSALETQTDGWHLYTVTFDGSTAKIYLDAELKTTASTPGVSALKLNAHNANYLALGTWSHDGTPQWDENQPGGDEYPNCCWMSGGMADLRIYNRVLSPTEIQSLFTMQANAGGTSTNNPTPATGNAPTQFMKFKNIFKPLKGEALQIKFNLAHDSHVKMTVRDRYGNEIYSLIDDSLHAGNNQEISWNGKNKNNATVGTGVYFIVLEGDGIHQIQKIVVVK